MGGRGKRVESLSELAKMADTRKITSIELEQKRKDRFSVFLDKEFAFGIHRETLLKTGIAKGDDLSEKQIKEIQQFENLRAAKEKGLRLLAARPRSAKELADRLKQARYSSETIEHVLKEFDRLGLLNDAEFGKMYARSQMITKPMGQFLLRRELKFKGLKEEEIEQAVDAAYEEQSEKQVAFELALRRKKRVEYLEEMKAKKRVSDFLQRRGFNWEIISDIIEKWKEL